jgi:hypothetical protein
VKGVRRHLLLPLLLVLPAAGEVPTFNGFLPDPPLTSRAHQAAASCIWKRNPGQARDSVSDYIERPRRGAMSKLKEMYPGCEQAGDPSNNIDPDRLAGALAELMLPADPLARPAVAMTLPIETGGGEDDLRLARCALAVAPGESLGVLRTAAGSAEEREAMQRLIPALGPCAPAKLGEFDRRLPRSFVRTQLALAAFAHVNGIAPDSD